ncbi:MAG: glycosyltransferase [Anaerolineales bacterium]|nr:glycosyltransferase [Anaerolineales bacterium]
MKTAERKLRILQIASAVEGGGGEQISLRLHRAFRRLGHRSMLFAGRLKNFSEADVFQIPDRWDVSARARNARAVFWRVLALTGGRGAARLFPFFEALAFPRVTWDLWRGHEDFTQPGSRQLLALAPEQPDAVLLHNLHARWNRREGFFDLEFLPELGRSAPVILFPQDPWLITGHCGHPIECPRWRIGCGKCPDLKIYPSVRRDATAWNFRRKRRIYNRSRLYLAAPSQWLLAMFAEAGIPLAGMRVIRNGIDTALFKPGGRRAARAELGLDPNRRIILISGNHLKANPWKGYGWVLETAERMSRMKKLPNVDFLCVGDEGEPVEFGGVRIIFAGFVKDPARMPAYYRTADVYFHPSRADTAPYSVLEAMATGLPVVATSVGGIPEQVEDGRTGRLAAPGDAEAMAARLAALLTKPEEAAAMGRRARARAVKLFDFTGLTEEFLEWIQKITTSNKK